MIIEQSLVTDQAIALWKSYAPNFNNWQQIVKNICPKECDCGLVYELPHPLNRLTESFAIADMSNLPFSEPHYHLDTEIYIILQGTGIVVVGGQIHEVSKDCIIVTPPHTAHFTIPEKDLVMAVINIPAFKIENYVPITGDNSAVKFSQKQFEELAYFKR